MPDAALWEQARHRLVQARARLFLDHPNLARWAAVLEPAGHDAPRPARLATDCRRLYFDPDFVNRQTTGVLAFGLAHVALHCALGHRDHGLNLDLARWRSACDRVVNAVLAAEGLPVPPEVTIFPEAAERSVDALYQEMEGRLPDAVFDEHWFTEDREDAEGESGSAAGADYQPDELASEAETDEAEALALEETWDQRFEQVAMTADRQGGSRGGLGRILDRELAHRSGTDWRRLLDRYLVQLSRTDFTYARPSRRSTDTMIMPALSQPELELVVALDISGSVRDGDLSLFLSELDSLKGQLRARLTIHACDNRLAEEGPWVIEPYEHFRWPGLKGRGGTDFRPIFDWVARRGAPDCLIYFTDGRGRFPETPPSYPVIWLVNGDQPPPWGEVIHFEGGER